MANYTYNQYCKMIDDCFTPEYLMMERALERQHYIDIFTEMHNYISENIIELPFDAEVFTEEETKSKSVWDKNDKGWDGFWRNVGRVLKNIWNKFWGFIKAIVTLSDDVKPQEAQKIANAAQEVAKEIEQKSDQEVQKAVEEKPEEVKAIVEPVAAIANQISDPLDNLYEIVKKRNEAIKNISSKFVQSERNRLAGEITDKAINEMQELIKSSKTDLNDIISNPEKYKPQRGELTSFLGAIAAEVEPKKVELKNKFRSVAVSLALTRLYDIKYLFDLMKIYPNQQGPNIKSALLSDIQNLINACIKGGQPKSKKIIYKSIEGITDPINEYLRDKFTSFCKIITLGKNGKALKTAKRELSNDELDKAIKDIETYINARKSDIESSINNYNLKELSSKDYIFELSSDGSANISEIPSLPEPNWSSDKDLQSISDIQQNMTLIITSVSIISRLIGKTKELKDRSLYQKINLAVNALSKL